MGLRGEGLRCEVVSRLTVQVGGINTKCSHGRAAILAAHPPLGPFLFPTDTLSPLDTKGPGSHQSLFASESNRPRGLT